MKRRSYLGSLATAGSLTALGGCVTTFADESDSPKYSVEVQPPEESPLDHSVSIVAGGYANPETPLTLEVELANPSDQIRAYTEERDATFHLSDSKGERFTLLPEENNKDKYRKFENGRWKVIREPGVTLSIQVGNLRPGETDTKERVLARNHDAEPPESPPDELTFSAGYGVTTDTEEFEMPDGETELMPDLSKTDGFSWDISLIRE